MAAHAYARTGAVALTPRGRTRAAKSQDQPTGSAVRREPTSPLCRWEPTGSLCRRDPTNSSVGRDSTTAVRRPCDGREHARRDPRCRCGRSGTDRPGRSLRTDPLPPSGKYTSRVAPMSRCRCPTGRARSMRSADVGIMTGLSAGRRNCHGQRAPDARAGPWAGRPCGRAARLATGAFRLPAEPSAQLFHEEVRRPAHRRGGEHCGYLTDARVLEAVRGSPGALDGDHLGAECSARRPGGADAAASPTGWAVRPATGRQRRCDTGPHGSRRPARPYAGAPLSHEPREPVPPVPGRAAPAATRPEPTNGESIRHSGKRGVRRCSPGLRSGRTGPHRASALGTCRSAPPAARPGERR